MVATQMEKEVSNEMKQIGLNLSKEMLSKCIGMATNYKITAAELATCWEAHSMNTNVQKLTPQTWTSYRSAIEQKYAKTKTPNQTTKKSAVVSRSAMAKRSAPSSATSFSSSSNNTKINTSKRMKGSNNSNSTDMGAVIGNDNDNDAQLEHIVSSSRQTSSPQKSSQSPTVLITPPKSKASSPSINVNYENRENAGVTVVSYNPNKLEPIISSSVRAAARNCLITQPFKSHLSKGYRYMTDKNRHDPLNAQLVRMTEAMMECHGIQSPTDEEEDSNAEQQQQQQQVGEDDKKHIAPYECVGVPRQSLQTNIGRVCNEAHDGKLNATTLLLEGSKFGSGGARIELDVSNVDHYSLFQGQIIGVSGINLNGRKMMVETLIEGLDYKATDINVDADVEVETNMNMSKETFGQEGVKIYAVAGPYTTNNNLEYQPLTDLLGVVEEEKPDVVVMMGPFVDMKHELVKNGEDLVLEYEDGTKRHVCYEQFFAAKIASELEALYEAEPELKTQFILVPSMDDAVSEPVFPQPPLESPLEKIMKVFPETEDMPFGSLCLDSIETAGDKKVPKESTDRRIHLVSNPSTIKINEVTVGFTSLDAFMHMSIETVNSKLPTGRMNRLAEHFIKQRSYYPIFPPSAGHGKDFNLDVTKLEAYAMPVQPDVLILPSKLTGIVMDVANGTTVVNPGHLVKGAVGGTYAIVDIHPRKKDDLETNAKTDVGHPIKDRIRVEVRKI